MLTYNNVEFDIDQKLEIDTGLADHLDVSVFAKKEYLAIQMRQIRLGMMAGVDVSQYARPEYDWFQMEEIRLGMEAGLDYKKYASPELDYQKMRQIRKGLEKGIDLSKFSRLEAGMLRQLRKATLSKVEIIDYIKQGYNVEQVDEIRIALEKKLDIEPYLSKDFRGASIREICNGLEGGIDPKIYANIEYGWQQMREIRLGLEHRVDVKPYINSLFSWQQMREIRLGLEEGIDISSYCRFMYTATDMARKRKALSTGATVGIVDGTAEVLKHQQFVVFISSDEMEARIELKCKPDETVTVQEVLQVLKSEGVTKGVIKSAVEKLVKEKLYNQSVLIARGKVSGAGKDGWYEYFFKTTMDRTPKVLHDGSVDYQHIRWYELVEEGQKIALYHEAEYGTPGYTVTGKHLNVKKGHEMNVLTGHGFVLLPDGKTYIAATSGKIDLIDDNKIEITKLYVVEEVNAATGNVDFDGCVYVQGNVGAGSVIRATEDVIVNGAVEGAMIKCGGEILLRQGANGAGHGVIEAGKKVTAKFFESINVISHGDIHANYALNCNMYAEGNIVIQGRKGMIAGGVAQAVRGIKAFNIGNHANLRTVLKLGVDESAMHTLTLIEKKIGDVNKELAILGNAYMDFQRKYPPEVRNTMEIYLKIENAIYTKELELDSLYKQKQECEDAIESMAGARAVIKGTMYEGSVVIIDNIKWVSHTVHDVIVRRANDRIVVYSN